MYPMEWTQKKECFPIEVAEKVAQKIVNWKIFFSNLLFFFVKNYQIII